MSHEPPPEEQPGQEWQEPIALGTTGDVAAPRWQTGYADLDDLMETSLNLALPIPGDLDSQQRLLNQAARDVDGYLGTSYEAPEVYAELTDSQRSCLREATCAQSMFRSQQGPLAWLGTADDVASAGSISFRAIGALPRLSPAVPELLAGCGLSMRGASLCASPSAWLYDPQEEFEQPEPGGAA